MTEQWYGKVALVIGGGAGIGRATALAFASREVRVVVADIQVAGGEATAQQIRR
jgi:NAD(P)-dependent dehydrogenase (short-subunit alcohol dehydrogenase family)